MAASGETVSERVLEALREVIDPELGMNVVDLGLVYDVEADERSVRVAMTMTSPACPLGEVITQQAEMAIRTSIAGLESVQVNLVWHPPWDPSRMSDSAKKRLGWT